MPTKNEYAAIEDGATDSLYESTDNKEIHVGRKKGEQPARETASEEHESAITTAKSGTNKRYGWNKKWFVVL